MYVPNSPFFHIVHLFFSGRGSFLALLASEHAGGAPVHYKRKMGGPIGLRGSCFGAQSRVNWHVITGFLSAEPERVPR